jgi:hypothetical protein
MSYLGKAGDSIPQLRTPFAFFEAMVPYLVNSLLLSRYSFGFFNNFMASF